MSPCKDGNGGSASIEGSSNEVGESLAELLDCDWVTCPVCGNKVRGEDYMINSHLGIYAIFSLVLALIGFWLLN